MTAFNAIKRTRLQAVGIGLKEQFGVETASDFIDSSWMKRNVILIMQKKLQRTYHLGKLFKGNEIDQAKEAIRLQKIEKIRTTTSRIYRCFTNYGYCLCNSKL